MIETFLLLVIFYFAFRVNRMEKEVYNNINENRNRLCNHLGISPEEWNKLSKEQPATKEKPVSKEQPTSKEVAIGSDTKVNQDAEKADGIVVLGKKVELKKE